MSWFWTKKKALAKAEEVEKKPVPSDEEIKEQDKEFQKEGKQLKKIITKSRRR
jgi:hypothetical protein